MTVQRQQDQFQNLQKEEDEALVKRLVIQTYFTENHDKPHDVFHQLLAEQYKKDITRAHAKVLAYKVMYSINFIKGVMDESQDL